VSRDDIRKLCDDIRRRALSPLVARRVKLKKVGSHEYLGLCPFHSERTPSFRVYDKAPTHYHCFGCTAHGDAITLYRELDNRDFFGAVEDAAAAVGLIADLKGMRQREYCQAGPAQSPEEELAQEEREEQKCRDIWRNALPAAGTPVERYLREHRKIIIEFLPGGIIPPTLRYEAAMPYWHPNAAGKLRLIGKFPAMVAPLQDITNKQLGLHITYLDPVTADKLSRKIDGEKIPAKKMRGTSWGCAVRLAEAAEFMSASEGIENALSAMMCGAPPAWAAASLNNLAGRGVGRGEPHPRRLDMRLPSVYPDMHPPFFGFPPVTKRVLQIEDNDSKDRESAQKLFQRSLRRFTYDKKTAFQYTPAEGFDMNGEVIAGLVAPGRFNETASA
jgi:DNA primase